MPRLSPLVLAAACAAAAAQTPPAPQAADDSAAPGRNNQRIERIVVEDAGSRVEEVRYAGQTQSITVQPKGDLPAYQVDPGQVPRHRAAGDRNGLSASGGQRSWNVLKF